MLGIKVPRRAPKITREKRREAAQMFTPPPPQTVQPTQPSQSPAMFMGGMPGMSRGTGFVPGGGMPGQSPQQGFDWSSALQGIGVGLLTGKGWGEGLGQGMLYARQFADQNRQTKAQEEESNLRRYKLNYEIGKDQKADQSAQASIEAWNAAVDQMNIPDQNKLLLKAMGPGSANYGDLFPGTPDQTTDQREYAQAVEQGFKGSLLDYQLAIKKAGAGNNSTTIYNKDYGTIPPGYRLVEGPQGATMEAVPGSPAAQADVNQQNQQAQAADIVTTDINRALGEISGSTLPTSGFFGQALSGVAGTGAHNVKELISSVRSNVSIDKLQQMRQASPTGGALGNVTEKENKMLADAIGSLEQSQSADQLDYNLKRVHNIYLDIVHGPGAGPARYNLPAVSGAGATPSKPSAPETTEDGYTIEELP